MCSFSIPDSIVSRPNVLALNFHASLAYLLFFMFAASLLLWYFWHATRRCKHEDANEGLQLSVPYTGSWRLIFVCFILSVIYLPLSTIAVHAIVWSSDFWANRSDESGSVPLGTANEFRDSTDICYTTTMKRNEINLAPIVFIASFFTFTAVRVPVDMTKKTTNSQLHLVDDLVSFSPPKDDSTGTSCRRKIHRTWYFKKYKRNG